VPDREPAAFAGDVLVHGEFPGQKQIRVIVSQTAIEQIQAHAISDLDREVGGVLLGRVARHQAQTFLEVLAGLPVSTVDHGPVHFTFTADAWAKMNRDREATYPDLDVVGWFHTHPGLGVFYSSDDVVVHSAAFTLPWQVGLVLDPLQGEACFFGWEQTPAGREIMPIAGFYEWLDQRQGTILGWEVTHRPNWRDDSHVRLAGSGWPALPGISPWWGFFLGLLSLLLSLGLLLERLLTR
jgi:proteasome lid subunit RPN8/RPN11